MNKLHALLRTYFPSQPEEAPSADKRTLWVLGSSSILLTFFYYFGLTGFYRRHAKQWELASYLPDSMMHLKPLLPYAYWGTSSLIIRILIPCFIIFVILKEKPSEWGLSFKGQLKQGGPYIGFFLFMLPFLFAVSHLPSFQKTYPFLKPVAQGGSLYWGFCLFYGLQFVSVEFFFRGFMVFGLFKKLGYYSLWIMCIPYVMIHFGKPLSETVGALIAGLVLGAMALKSRSIWWGVALHCAIAYTMDFLSMYQKQEAGLFEFAGRLFFGS